MALLKVDLGSADTAHAGFDRHVDIVRNVNVPADKMIVADLMKPWPFADSTVGYFRAHDIIEHLPDKIFTLNEVWRCLAPSGTIEISVPTIGGVGSVCDPQHISYWSRMSFEYFRAGSPEHNRFARHYGIKAKFAIVKEEKKAVDKPFSSGIERIEHLLIILKAVKP